MTDHHDTHTAALPTPGAGPLMRMLAVAGIVSSPTNPRKHFDQAKLQELAESIQASGVHQPILVRPLPGSRVEETSRARRDAAMQQAWPFPKKQAARDLPPIEYELVAGERRWRACQMAGLAEIPAMIRELSDDQVLEIQIVENLQRDDLTELEEAEGYEHLMQHSGLNADQVGAKIGKSRSYVYARLKLLALCHDGRKALREGKIDASKGLLIARIPDEALQLKALKQISLTYYYGGDPMSYREAAAYVQREFMLRLDQAVFKITDATLIEKAGSCRECPKRTGAAPDLFADVKGADVCTDPPCFHAKEQAHADRMKREALERGQTLIEGREAKALMPNSWSGKVEGYLRLDDKADSPADKPLRKLIGKQLEKAGVQPTLIANPHRAGELVAVITREQAAELLKAQGHDEAAQRVDEATQHMAKADAAQAKKDRKQEYEETWRWNVLEHAWTALQTSQVDLSTAVVRHVASHYASLCNMDDAKRLCKLLGLGKVAPKDGLAQHVNSTDKPGNVLMLLLMYRDRAYRHWLDANDQVNEGLLLIAGECKVDVEAVKAQTQAAMRAAAKEAAKKAAKPEAPETADTPPPAAQAKTTRAKGKTGKGTDRPAAPAGESAARKRKLSAEEASLGIAAAMQGVEETNPGAAAAAQGDEAGPVADALAPGAGVDPDTGAPTEGAASEGAFLAGQRVTVNDTVNQRQIRFKGRTGTVVRQTGPEAFDVSFPGRAGGLAGFHTSELEAAA